jgi:hypothetical protein
MNFSVNAGGGFQPAVAMEGEKSFASEHRH